MNRRDHGPRDSAEPAGNRFGWAALGIFCVALLVRLIHLWQIRRAPFFAMLMGDSREYDAWAQRIAAGDWLGHDVFYQAPLYPYFLGTIYAAAGHDLLVVRLCQAAVGAAACVFLGLTAARLFSRTAGLIAGLALALYAPAIFFDSLMQKTVLDVFLVCLALLLMSRIVAQDTPTRIPAAPAKAGAHKRQRGQASSVSSVTTVNSVSAGVGSGFGRIWLLLGLTMGALALTRENAMVFVAVIVVWALVGTSGGIRAAGVFLLGIAIVLLPVAIRNSVVGGGFYVTTSQFGPNFYLGNNAYADGTAQSLRVGRGSAEYERQDAVELAEHALGRRLTPGEVSQFWTDRALAFITSRPGAWLSLMTRKFALLWNATEMLDTESQESYAEWSTPVRLGARFGHFGVLVPLALIGVWVTWPDRKRLWVLHAMVAAYAASVLLFFIYARYRFPLVPFLMLFAAAGFAWILELVREPVAFWRAPAAMPSREARHRRSTRWGWGPSASEKILAVASVVVLVAAVAFTNWPVLSPALMRAITEHNLGAALQSEGRVDEAMEHYRRALSFKADHAPALNNLGTALAAKGDVAGAIDSYERALAASPDYASAHYNLANALLQTGSADKAADHLRQALQSAPGSAEVHNNLGIALADEGRYNEAIAELRKALEFDLNSAKTHRNLGNVLASAGRPAEAIDYLRKAVSLDPLDGPALYDLATLLVEAQRLPEAVDTFRAALAVMPDSVDVLNNLGIALASLGRLDEAIGVFERAISLQPDFAPAQRNLAAALQQRRQPAGRLRP